METKKELIKILILMLVLIISLQTKILASTLVLNAKTDKDNYKVSENIDFTVDWKENMQAASFKIGYDPEKLKFVSASINENFYNSKIAGEISINWASFEGTDLTQIKIQFKALKEGKTNISIKQVSAFADGDLVSPTNYDISTSGTRTIIIGTNNEIVSNPENSEPSKELEGNNKPSSSNKNPEKKDDNSIATSPYPQTGVRTIIIIIIIIMGVLSVRFYIKSRKFSGI